MAPDAPVVADRLRSRIDECNALSQANAHKQIETHGWQNGWIQLYNARISDQSRETAVQMLKHLLQIVEPEVATIRPIEVN